MNIKTVKQIEVQDWDNFVKKTYGKIYSFQQQDGCKPRGIFNFTVPNKWGIEDYENDSIPEVINGTKMGVSFKSWLERSIDTPLNPSNEELKDCYYYCGKTKEEEEQWKNDKSHIYLFWQRNFYPRVDMIIDDLHKKGLLEEGEYQINIDW